MKKKILIIIIPLLIIAGTALGAFYYVNSKIYIPTPENSIFENEKQQEEAEYAEEKGIINILLIGVDGRENDKDARTDSIILATIDANNKKVKLTSFMRDMYLPIPGHGQNRINTAYFLGGPELLLKTINQDFNLNVQHFMSIDFRAFQDLVEKLGGIDVEVKENEVKQINYYIKEANWNNPIYIEGPGYQHLNGQQALSYSRIRKVGNGDYERTERQRKVLSLLVDKARETSIIKLPQLFSAVMPYLKTNIPTTKLMNLGYTAYKFGNTPIESLRIPADGMFDDMKINGASVLVPNIERNVLLLEKFMYSSGGAVTTNLPVYMENNFHADDKAIDKRGVKRKTVEIIIPKEEPKEQPVDVDTEDPQIIDIENGEEDPQKETDVEVDSPQDSDNVENVNGGDGGSQSTDQNNQQGQDISSNGTNKQLGQKSTTTP
jgi:polyisoprenyl-teichoic acid--peptidoglycan teichoic acid transferase